MKRFSKQYYYSWEAKHQKQISNSKPKVRKNRVEYDCQKNARNSFINCATKNMSEAEPTQFNHYIKMQHIIMKNCKSMDLLYNGDIIEYHSHWDSSMVPMMGATPKGKLLLSAKTNINFISDSQNQQVQEKFENLFYKKFKDTKPLPTDTPGFWKRAFNERDNYLLRKHSPPGCT